MIEIPLNNKQAINPTNPIPRILWFVILTYSMLSLLSHWFTICILSLKWLTLNAGLLLFPINFLLSSLITEVYGYKYARRTVWCGFFFNLLFIIYGQVIVHMPSPNDSIHNSQFDKLISIYLKTIPLSVISYFIVEPFNLFLIAKSKIHNQGSRIKFRFILVTSLSTLTSIIIFSLLNFRNTSLATALLPTLYCTGITISLISTIAVELAKKIKKLEKIDIYDIKTEFDMFKFEILYPVESNKFNNIN